MERLKSVKTLTQIVLASGVFDLVGGVYFILLVGVDKSISNPPTHPFYAILIGIFLLCLGYLQIMSSFNIQRYLFNIGTALLSRIFYVILFTYYFLSVKDFPTTFLPTCIADLIWTVLIIFLIGVSNEFRVKDLFLPVYDRV